MNVTLQDAAVFDTDGECQYFPEIHIQARNIRYVHIPDNVSFIHLFIALFYLANMVQVDII